MLVKVVKQVAEKLTALFALHGDLTTSFFDGDVKGEGEGDGGGDDDYDIDCVE